MTRPGCTRPTFAVRSAAIRAVDQRGSASSSERGAALLITFLMALLLSGLALAMGVFAHNSVVSGKSQWLDRRAFYIAEAGWQRARQALNAGTWVAALSPGGVYTEAFGGGEYRVTVLDNGDATYTITSEGYVPSQAVALAKRKIVERNLPASYVSGTNLSLDAEISASSSQSGEGKEPENANDGELSTKWQADTKGSGEWLALDYEIETTVDRVVVEEHPHIDGLSVEISDDGAAWTTVTGLTVVESPAKTWTADFTAASTQYLRVVFTDVPGTATAGVKELQSSNTAASLGQGTVTTQW